MGNRLLMDVMSDEVIGWCAPDQISFAVAEDGKSITFQPCGMTSFNAHDVEKRYCARCHRYMDLVMLAREMKKENFSWTKS